MIDLSLYFFSIAGLYALINNAGVCVCGEFDWQTWNHIESQVNVNILGTLRVIKAFLPLLKVSTDPGNLKIVTLCFTVLRPPNMWKNSAKNSYLFSKFCSSRER